ncbi:MAG TPA: hypothetical protein VFE51_31115 [Verrucomicrobiae bacterium]|nr:hypothetical protein [Verrucomicrobiae bacterium]
MKTLEKDELFQNLQGFLKTKGLELKEGSYAQKIQKSCTLLSDAINIGQQGLARAKLEVDKKLDQVRQVIHEKTAPSGPKPSSASPPQGQPSPASAARPKSPKSKSKTPKRPKQR